MRYATFVLLLVLPLVSQACATVRPPALEPAPSVDAPLEVREAYASENRAVGPVTILVPQTLPFSSPKSLTFLQLEDGRRIEDPAQLLPALEPSSATAQAISRGIAARERAETLASLTQTGSAVAMGGLVTGAATSAFGITNPNKYRAALAAGAVTMQASAATALAAAILSVSADQAAREVALESATAFTLYNDDLRRGLALPPVVIDAPAPADAPVAR